MGDLGPELLPAGHEGRRPSLTAPKRMKALPRGTREPETLGAIVVWSESSQAGEDQGDNWAGAPAHRTLQSPRGGKEASAPAMVFQLGHLSCWAKSIQEKVNLEPFSSTTWRRAVGQRRDPSGVSPPPLLALRAPYCSICMLAITKGHVTMSQTQLASTTLLLPAKRG